MLLNEKDPILNANLHGVLLITVENNKNLCTSDLRTKVEIKIPDGTALGVQEGAFVVGPNVGAIVGINEGALVGKKEGAIEGENDGMAVATTEGVSVGKKEGAIEGAAVGS